MTNDYTTRELDTHFAEIKETLARIEAQTIKTNGRVSVLEVWKANNKGWLAGFSAAAIIIIGLISYIFNKSVGELKVSIQNHVDATTITQTK